MLRRNLRRLRFTLFTVGAVVVIALALTVGLGQLAMPWLTRNPERVEAWLSERLHQPVHVGHLNAVWAAGGPVMTLDDVRIGNPDKQPLQLPRAELALDFYAPLRGDRAWSEFRLVGVDVQLVHDEDGWHLRGFDLGKAAGAAPARSTAGEEMSMGPLGALVFKDLKLSIEDAREDIHLALAASELRVVNRGEITHIAGKVRNLASDQTPIDLIADVDVNRRAGTFYAGGKDVDLAGFAGRRAFGGLQLLTGRGNAQVWANVDAAHVDDLRLRIDLADVSLASTDTISVNPALAVAPRAHFDRLAFVARWLREADGWSADVADLVMTHGEANTQPARIGIDRSGKDSDTRYRAALADLPVEPVGSIAMLTPHAPPGLRRWIYLAHPHGQLANADLDWRGAQDFNVNAVLRDAGLADAQAVPGVEHIDVELHGDAQALLLQVPVQALRVDYPHVFRKPFLFSQFGGDIVAFRDDAAWRIDTDRIVFEGEGYGGELRGGVEIQDDHTRPLLDLAAVVTHADVVAAKLFWPTITMPPAAVAWLDRGLVSGKVDGGRVVVYGDLDSWPFHDESGRFEARGHVTDTVLDYDPQWPRAEKLDAIATFIGDSMQVEVDSAEAGAVRVTSASGSIANLGEPVLELAAKGGGSGANLLAFLRASPIGKQHQDALKDLAIGGKGELDMTLNLPIKEPPKLVLDGKVELAGANLDHAAYNLHFVDANGMVRFNQRGFAAGPLAVGFRQRSATLAIASGGYVQDSRHALEGSLKGKFPVTTVFADLPDLASALSRFPGEAEWTSALTIDSTAGAETGGKRLTLASDLRGIAIDLPAPLTKSTDAAQPFQLALQLPLLGEPFTASLGDFVFVKGRLPAPGKPFAARVQFGAQPGSDLPARGVTIAGRVPVFDAGGWLGLAQHKGDGGGDSGSGILNAIDLHADEFTIADRDFGATRLTVQDAGGVTELKLDGPSLLGTLSVPGQALARQGVTARFERFHWPDSPPDAPESDALSDADPAALPPLHLAVDDFMLGKANFGSAQFESYPSGQGMRVDKLESNSPNVNMSASGDWTGTPKDNHSHLVIALTAQNLGHMMDALGFSGVIDGGQTTATIDAVWPGPPSTFALSKFEKGTIALKVAEGRIPEVHPGAGRIFGLLSLSEIPRRLSLDFSDFFQSGLSFNSITGTFRVEDGNAYTDDLLIKSPAADILITGRTGLRTKDYDQEMLVTPHTSATLPIVGAIAGGPVGAAAGLVLQGVLGKPMGRAMGSRYKVSGSWDKPEITLIARDNSRSRRADDKPAEGELR
jgi:uncharacterized protein (TIGR02099 family)